MADQAFKNKPVAYFREGARLPRGRGNFYYGARYYDPKISVWLSVDAMAYKYPGLSPYAFVANNPLIFFDPDGNDIWITHGNQSYRYENGKLFDSNGVEYLGKQSGFLGQAVSALNTIGSTKEGGSMLTELQSSKNTYTIVQGTNDNNFTTESGALNKMKSHASQVNNDPAYAKTKQTIANNGIDITGGAGGTITWDPNGAIVPTTAGADNNPTVNLAHEMFYALDANRGQLDARKDIGGIERSEWQAVYRENILRSELGAPLRTYYGIRKNQHGQYRGGTGPKMLDSGGKPIKPSWYTP